MEKNVPFYHEVQAFVLALERALETRGLGYGIGAEHAHSCCVLLADRGRFFKPAARSAVVAAADSSSEVVGHQEEEGEWHTLIDYPAFFRCLESGKPFGPEDYIGGPTPEWARWGHGGFDPRDVRVDRKGRPKVVVEEVVEEE